MPTKKVEKPAQAPRERQQPELGYEEGIAHLEELVKRMEGGTLSLEETLAAYERGMALHGQLEAILQRGERRIQALLRTETEIEAVAKAESGGGGPQTAYVDFEVEE